MSKFKVGDKVRVREWDDLAEGHAVVEITKSDYANCQKSIVFGREFIHPVMSWFCGKTVTISAVYEDSADPTCYEIEEYDGDIEIYWEDWMLEDEVIG